jgi:hypothetical protein
LFWIIGGALVGLLYSAWTKLNRADSENEAFISAVPSETSQSQVLNSRLQNAFVYNHGQTPQRELAPTDPRYDPVAHARQDDLTAQEIFEAEPRDTTFAPVFERRIQANYADAFRELSIESRVLSLNVECRTLSCYARVQVNNSDLKYVYQRIGGLVLGDVLMPSMEGADSSKNAEIKLYMLFGPSLRADEDFQSALNAFSLLVHKYRDKYARNAATDKETR